MLLVSLCASFFSTAAAAVHFPNQYVHVRCYELNDIYLIFIDTW